MKTELRFETGSLWKVAADLITFGYKIHRGSRSKTGELVFLVSLGDENQ
jgi:hypothetical protein